MSDEDTPFGVKPMSIDMFKGCDGPIEMIKRMDEIQGWTMTADETNPPATTPEEAAGEWCMDDENLTATQFESHLAGYHSRDGEVERLKGIISKHAQDLRDNGIDRVIDKLTALEAENAEHLRIHKAHVDMIRELESTQAELVEAAKQVIFTALLYDFQTGHIPSEDLERLFLAVNKITGPRNALWEKALLARVGKGTNE